MFLFNNRFCLSQLTLHPTSLKAHGIIYYFIIVFLPWVEKILRANKSEWLEVRFIG